MPKRIKDTSKKLPKISREEFAKALGAERRSPLELIIGESDAVPIGEPVLYVPGPAAMIVPFEQALEYIRGRFAANHYIDAKEIIGYKLLESDALVNLQKQLGASGCGIQFCVHRDKLKEVMKYYKPFASCAYCV